MRWKAAITIACVMSVCAALLLWFEYRRRPVERVNALRAHAAKGDPKAQFDLGSTYYYGKGVPQDYAEAYRWFKRAAERGEPRAEDALGYMYFEGKGVPQDYDEAIRWYRTAADLGYTKAQLILGDIYYNGTGVQQDNVQAVRWYQRAGEQGNAKAQFMLGDMYYYGQGVTRNCAEAFRWYRRAAEQGDAKSQDGLGYMYYSGLGGTQDYAEALRWYRRAAEQGDSKAEFDLASMYYHGKGVQQNFSEARRWYFKAAKQGNADAQQALRLFGGAISGDETRIPSTAGRPAVWVMVASGLRRASRKHPRLATGSSVAIGASFPGKLWNEPLRYRPWWLALLFISGCFPHCEAGLNWNRSSDHRNSGLTRQEIAGCRYGAMTQILLLQYLSGWPGRF